MAIWVRCENCGETFRQHSSDLEDEGTLWQPAFRGECPSCGATFHLGTSATSVFDQAEVRKVDPDTGEARLHLGTVEERGTTDRILEEEIQKYFAEHYEIYGFADVAGPFKRGPDFRGKHSSYKRKVGIEVERKYSYYLKHKHDQDPNFRNTRFLVVLHPSDPPNKTRERLPHAIIHLDIGHFVDWWLSSPSSRRFASVCYFLTQEFARLAAERCQDKDRPMATCPDCDHCPYFCLSFTPTPMACLAMFLSDEGTFAPGFELHRVDRSLLEEVYDLAYHWEVDPPCDPPV